MGRAQSIVSGATLSMTVLDSIRKMTKQAMMIKPVISTLYQPSASAPASGVLLCWVPLLTFFDDEQWWKCKPIDPFLLKLLCSCISSQTETKAQRKQKGLSKGLTKWIFSLVTERSPMLLEHILTCHISSIWYAQASSALKRILKQKQCLSLSLGSFLGLASRKKTCHLSLRMTGCA